MGRYKMSNVAISMNGVVKSWVGFSLATNGSGLGVVGAFSTALDKKHERSNLAIMLVRSTSAPITPNPCYVQVRHSG